MTSRPATVDSSRQAAGPGQLTPLVSARHTRPATPELDKTTESAPVHAASAGDRDYLAGHPQSRAGAEAGPRPAVTRTWKRWPFVLPPGWTWHRRSRGAGPVQHPVDEERPR
jgi:hypothetical protein